MYREMAALSMRLTAGSRVVAKTVNNLSWLGCLCNIKISWKVSAEPAERAGD